MTEHINNYDSCNYDTGNFKIEIRYFEFHF